MIFFLSLFLPSFNHELIPTSWLPWADAPVESACLFALSSMCLGSSPIFYPRNVILWAGVQTAASNFLNPEKKRELHFGVTASHQTHCLRKGSSNQVLYTGIYFCKSLGLTNEIFYLSIISDFLFFSKRKVSIFSSIFTRSLLLLGFHPLICFSLQMDVRERRHDGKWLIFYNLNCLPHISFSLPYSLPEQEALSCYSHESLRC